jgi:hypothetical protein
VKEWPKACLYQGYKTSSHLFSGKRVGGAEGSSPSHQVLLLQLLVLYVSGL